MATNIPAEEWKEWGRLVDQLNVQALVEEQDTRVVNATDTMIDALGLFAAHDVLSAPVYDATCNGFVGLIDMLDLVAFLCRFSGSLGGTKRLEREQLNLDALKHQLASLNEDQRAQIRATPVTALIGLSVSVKTPGQTLVKLLTDPNTHRIPITAEEGDQFLGILSQLDLAKWLHQHRESVPKVPQYLLASMKAKSLRGLVVRDFASPGAKKEMVTVPSHATMIEALLKIDEHKVSALPVVDVQGYLKGTISASDIKKLKLEPSDQPEEMLQKMFVPVSYCLTGSPLTCTMDHSLEDVLGAMTANKVHRVWTVDSNNKPVGVVSLCDVLAQFVPPTPESYLT
ncbi:CBS domain containing protein [Acanthamoeba castellanii str. Neff]|uniref:CBS domain containing protein n=1 Tax=Acanthamoeba castellanii (strain ATCC 30010 / Neff) TaxID=1257118 RepID=L8GH26_ACACF|nr:CBS domain containing protein [Acanthamoeba castellanii str. Neff]ELR12292.1 CBS domain containing protein [Acanthamoeba castellanii str. Neff]